MLITFDFELDAWIRNLEIEADSVEDALGQLKGMTLDEIIEAADVKTFDIKEVDGELTQRSLNVIVSNLEYEVDDDEADMEKINDLPNTFHFNITALFNPGVKVISAARGDMSEAEIEKECEFDIREAIDDELYFELPSGVHAISYDYTIASED